MLRVTLFILGGSVVLVIGAIGFGLWQYRGALPAILPVTNPIQTPTPNTIAPPAKNEITYLNLPAGFKIYKWAEGIENARVLTWGENGYLLVSSPKLGKIFGLKDKNGDGEAEDIITVADKLNKPHGITTKCEGDLCQLYVAEEDKLSIYNLNKQTGLAENQQKLLDFPSGGRHFTRTLLFLPSPQDNILLISVGSACDVCYEKDERNGTILSYDIKTKQSKIYVHGLRNSVFMNLHPVNGEVWATEMGRDNLGDNLPPDEINIIKPEQNYGWPQCYGQNIHDDKFENIKGKLFLKKPCSEPFEMPSYIDLPAHSAPLGLAFIPEEGWPEDWWYNLLVSYHGSWNKTEPTGYKIVRFKLDAKGKVLGVEDFLNGFLQGSRVAGRPVDILVQPGGTIFISDDKAGIIYKIIKTSDPDIKRFGIGSDKVKITSPASFSKVGGNFIVSGEALGTWFFEASMPLKLIGEDGKILLQIPAQARDNWMTENLVPFQAEINTDYKGSAIIHLEKDNPAGFDFEQPYVEIPIIIN
ncbi:MAG: PQQ-dependent sugar dehydrogenase [Patescibacteria group bacterium]